MKNFEMSIEQFTQRSRFADWPNPDKRAPLYRMPDGTEYARAPKGWTDAQKKKYRIKS